MLKKLIMSLIGFVVTIVLVVGGTILFVNAKYGINMIDVAKSLKKLGTYDVATIVPKAPEEADYPVAMSTINSSLAGLISYNSEEDKYTFNTELSGTMSEDMRLTDKQVCILLNWMIDSQEDGLKVNIGGSDVNLKDYDFKLAQVALTAAEGNAVNFNIVMSLSLKPLKDKMGSFPFNFLKGKVPDMLYISSTVKVTKTEGTFAYNVESVSLALNDMSGEEVEKLFKLANIFMKIGEVSNFNLSLGEGFVNALIGKSEEIKGFAYSMKGAGAVDFEFDTTGAEVYFVVKK